MSYAFTATVSEVSARVAESLPDAADFDWHIELDVGHTYRGTVPDRLVANGWEQGCDFTGIRVHEGDRLFVAAEKLDPRDPRLITSHLLVWRGIGGGRWEFYRDALHDGVGYPSAALNADTTEEILASLGGTRPPNTSTAPLKPEETRDMRLPWLATVLVSVFIGMLLRPKLRRNAGPSSED